MHAARLGGCGWSHLRGSRLRLTLPGRRLTMRAQFGRRGARRPCGHPARPSSNPSAGEIPWPESQVRGRCMTESIPPDPVSAPRLAGDRGRAPGRFATLAVVLEIALALRVATADAVEWSVRRGGQARLDLFPDTDIYWELARAIRAGGPYEYVEWGDIPHFAIRTPGY